MPTAGGARGPTRPSRQRPIRTGPVGQSGIAAVPTSALDPPHCAASPAVPALIGSGSPSRRFLKFDDLLKFAEEAGMMLRQMTDDAGISQQLRYVSNG